MSQKQLEQELEAAILRLGLDEIANEALHRVPLETAREIVQALDGGVRNPSAFVMSKIRGVQDGLGGAPLGRLPGGPVAGERSQESKPEMQRRNEAMLDRLGADERARNIAREIPPESLYDIFNQLNHNMREIRNPSAFIFQACVNFQKQHPQPTGYPSYPPQQPFVMRPGATPEQVDEAVTRLELDEAAAADMRALPPESAMGILEQITEGVKNKSAFATTAARRITGRLRSRSRSRSQSRSRRQSRGPGGGRSRSRGRSPRERSRSRDRGAEERRGGPAASRPRQLSHAEATEVVERMVKRCDLDDQAARAMRALQPDDAMRIMEDIQRNSEVRNASAFAYTAAKKLQGSFNLEEAQRKFDLDETAVSGLSALLPGEAREILDSIDEGLRNPSAFVMAQVRRLRPELGSLPGGGPPHGAPGGAPGPCGRGPCPFAGLPPGVSVREMEEEVEGIIRRMNLDERASGVLHEVPLAKAMDILNELRRNWGNVRNPSAYVFNACVKEINNPASRGLDSGFPPVAPGMMPGPHMGMPGQGMGMPGGMPGHPFGMGGPAPGMPLGMHGQGLGPSPGPGPGAGLPQGMPGPPASFPPAPVAALGPAGDSGARREEVERAIQKWNLDETALGALLQIPADQALEILNSLDGGVRNPSAFVTTAARKRQETGLGGPPSGGGSFGMASDDAVDFRQSLKDQVEHLIRKSDLDQKATGILHELPLEGALEILGELQRKWDQVRNPSAYVFNAGVKFQEKLAHGRAHVGAPAPANPAAMAQRVEALAMRLRLDADSLNALHTVPLEMAVSILEQMREDVTDPSEYVRRTVDRVHQQARGLGEAADPYANEHAIAQRAESMARELGVDDNSLAALQTIPLEQAMHCLTRLGDSRSSIRNPSAFIISAVKDYRAQAGGGGGLGPPPPDPYSGGAGGGGGGCGCGGLEEPEPAQVARQLDAAIQRLGLDRTATDALSALPAGEALALVSSVDGNVRNPSAWVTNAARNALLRAGGAPGDDERMHGAPEGSPAWAPVPSTSSGPPPQVPPPPAPPAPPPAPTPSGHTPPPPPPPPPRQQQEPGGGGAGGGGAEGPISARKWAKWDLHTWLRDIDGGTGALAEYSTVLSRNLESPEQVVEIYCPRATGGRLELDESFFRDVGIENPGHQQLFHRWFDRHLNG